MREGLFRKGVLIVIIILFIGLIVIPIISGINVNLKKSTNKTGIYDFLNQKNPYGNPPNEEWNKTYGGSDYDYDVGYCVQQTTDDGYIIAGWSAPPGDVHYSLMVKTDVYGNETWNKSNGELPGYTATSVQQTRDGGYIVTGNDYLNESIFADIFLCKTDSYGNEEWTKIIDVSGDDVSNCVKQVLDGGFVLTGSTVIFDGYEPVDAFGWLIKTDSYGNIQWTKTYPSLSFCNSVVETTDRGYILIGGLTNSFDSEDCDVLLIKTDINGNTIWSKIFGGDEYEFGYSVLQTSDQGYILTGPRESLSSGNSKVWLIKTDTYGNEIWNMIFGGHNYDMGYSVDQTNDGGYIISGCTNSFGFGSDAWLIKTDEQGHEMWNKTFGPYGSSYSVEQTNDGGYIMVGQTEYYGYPKGNVWLIKVAPDYEYQPNLNCSDEFNWTDIKPGSIVTDSFSVENAGGIFSLLDWEIESFPEWGTWSFDPDGGEDLLAGDSIIVDVEIVAPDEQDETFTGEVVLVNSNDPDDTCIIDVSLATPVNQQIDTHPLFQRILERFPNAFPILRHLLGL